MDQVSDLSKADQKELGSLHGALAKVLKDAIQATYKDPETGAAMPPPAAILSVARQFLKDNKIEAIAAPGSPLGDLSDLPVFDEDSSQGYRQ
jgi:hypothetical protein